MKFYYQAVHHLPYEEDDFSFLCSFERELAKGDHVVVYLHDDVGFAIAKITKRVSEVDALSQRTRPVEIIQQADKVNAYERRLEDQVKLDSMRMGLDEMAKEVKTMESYRKLASQNQRFREMFEAYERLEKGEGEIPSDMP